MGRWCECALVVVVVVRRCTMRNKIAQPMSQIELGFEFYMIIAASSTPQDLNEKA